MRISSDLSALALASFFTEIVDLTLRESQETMRIFSLLDWALRRLDVNGCPLQILPFFELQWLEASGLQPELHHCLKCKSATATLKNVSFSYGRGGIVCWDCRSELRKNPSTNDGEAREIFSPLQLGTMKGLGALQSAGWENFARIELSHDQVREAHKILKSFLCFHIGREFKSVRFLDQTLSRTVR
jgi:DNA repair protein RecO (recombination protein O)